MMYMTCCIVAMGKLRNKTEFLTIIMLQTVFSNLVRADSSSSISPLQNDASFDRTTRVQMTVP